MVEKFAKFIVVLGLTVCGITFFGLVWALNSTRICIL
jgi:hypothetical protein